MGHGTEWASVKIPNQGCQYGHTDYGFANPTAPCASIHAALTSSYALQHINPQLVPP